VSQHKVSIIITVHNAPQYTRETLATIAAKTHGIEHELIIVDNGSDNDTKDVLAHAYAQGIVDFLITSKRNLLFAKGNNLGANVSSSQSTHLLLMNSDIRIVSADWLSVLLGKHREGASAFGCVDSPPQRADGYCFLINRHLFMKYRLDERFPWWWSITKLQAELLRDGFSVLAIRNHEEYLHHYGGRSKVSPQVLRESQEVDHREVLGWFGDHQVVVSDFA
jgi:glycosyltransferase involved in cell wall biosynthesis